MNNHAGTTLTLPTGTTFHIVNAQQSCLREGCHWHPRPYNWGGNAPIRVPKTTLLPRQLYHLSFIRKNVVPVGQAKVDHA